MSLQVEKLENNMAKLTIEVPADDLEKALQSAYMKQKNKIAMPGFRKGKVPRQMIEKMYGPEIFYDDAANALIPKAYSEAYEECELEIVSRPEINVVQIEKGKSFIFTADVATKPEVKLGEYKGLEVDKVSTRVTQKEVDAKIQEEAEKNAREVVVTDRAVADGDEVILDFEGFVDGIKSFVVPAILTLLASSLFVFIYYNPVLTPVTTLLLNATNGFNVALSGIYTIINSVFYVDYYYLAYSVLYSITSVYSDKSVLSIISVMFTNLYSLVMLVAPTSVLLLISLSLSDVKYTEWFKFIWKLALMLLVISFIVFTVMFLV